SSSRGGCLLEAQSSVQQHRHSPSQQAGTHTGGGRGQRRRKAVQWRCQNYPSLACHNTTPKLLLHDSIETPSCLRCLSSDCLQGYYCCRCPRDSPDDFVSWASLNQHDHGRRRRRRRERLFVRSVFAAQD
ncbi:unnamed protein product, partial [Ectocarpus fasciculatus]